MKPRAVHVLLASKHSIWHFNNNLLNKMSAEDSADWKKEIERKGRNVLWPQRNVMGELSTPAVMSAKV